MGWFDSRWYTHSTRGIEVSKSDDSIQAEPNPSIDTATSLEDKDVMH